MTAIDELRAAVARAQRVGGNPRRMLQLRYRLAAALVASGDVAGALATQERAVADAERLLGPGHDTTLQLRRYLAVLAAQAHEPERAFELARRSAAYLEARYGRGCAEALNDRATALGHLLGAGRHGDVAALAGPVLRDCCAVDGQTGHVARATLLVRDRWAQALMQLGRVAEALPLATANEPAVRTSLAWGDAERYRLLATCGRVFAANGRDAQAAAILTETLDYLAAHPTAPGECAPLLITRGEVLARLGDAVRAAADLEAGVAEFRSVGELDRALDALSVLAAVHEASGDHAGALRTHAARLELTIEADGGESVRSTEQRLAYAAAAAAAGEPGLATRLLQAVTAAPARLSTPALMTRARADLIAQLVAAGEPAGALPLARAQLAAVADADPDERWAARAVLADVLERVGAFDEALEIRTARVRELDATHPGSAAAAAARDELAAAAWAGGRPGDALSWWRHELKSAERRHGASGPRTVAARDIVIAACLDSARFEEAGRLLGDQVRHAPDPERPRYALEQGAALLHAGRPGAAGAVLRQAAAAGRGSHRDELALAAAAALARSRSGIDPGAARDLDALAEQAQREFAGLEFAAAVALAAAEAWRELEPRRAAAWARDAVDTLHRWRPASAEVLLHARLTLAEAEAAAGEAEAAADSYRIVVATGGPAESRRAARALLALGRDPAVDGPTDPAEPELADERRNAALAWREREQLPERYLAAQLELGRALTEATCYRAAEAALADAVAAADLSADPTWRWWALARSSWALEGRGAHDDARATLERALDEAERTLGTDHGFTQQVRDRLAELFEEHEHWDLALWHRGRNVLSLTRTLGRRAEATLEARRLLSRAAAASGQLTTAYDLGESSLAAAEAAFPPGHLVVLEARNTMAQAQAELGDQDGARELFERNLVDAEAALAPDDEILLPFRSNLVIVYLRQGRDDEALALMRRAAGQAERVLPPGHPERLDMRRRLASVYARIGQPDQAVAELERAQADVDAHAGPGSPEAKSVARQRAEYALEAQPANVVEERRRAALAAVPSDRTAARDVACLLAVTHRQREAAAALLLAGLPIDRPGQPEPSAQRLADAGPEDLVPAIRAAAEEFGYGDPAVTAAVDRLLATVAPLDPGPVEALADAALAETQASAELLAPALQALIGYRVARLRAAGERTAADAVAVTYVSAQLALLPADDPRRVPALVALADVLAHGGDPERALGVIRIAQAQVRPGSPEARRCAQRERATRRAGERLGFGSPQRATGDGIG